MPEPQSESGPRQRDHTLLKYEGSRVIKCFLYPRGKENRGRRTEDLMVNLASVRDSNAQIKLTGPLVAVFVGGTSGIGRASLLELATLAPRGKGLRVYIVTRNASSQHDLIDQLRIASGDNISATLSSSKGKSPCWAMCTVCLMRSLVMRNPSTCSGFPLENFLSVDGSRRWKDYLGPRRSITRVVCCSWSASCPDYAPLP